MFTSVTRPRYLSRSETESPEARSITRNSGAWAPTATGSTSLPTRVRMAAPALSPASTTPTNTHWRETRTSDPHGAAPEQLAHRPRRVGGAEHGRAGHEGIGTGAPRLANRVDRDAATSAFAARC